MKLMRLAVTMLLAFSLTGCAEIFFGLGSLGIGGYGLIQRQKQTEEIRKLKEAVERHQEEVRKLREGISWP